MAHRLSGHVDGDAELIANRREIEGQRLGADLAVTEREHGDDREVDLALSSTGAEKLAAEGAAKCSPVNRDTVTERLPLDGDLAVR